MKIQKEGFLALVKSARTRILAAILLTFICAGTVAAAALSKYDVKIIDGEKVDSIQTSQADASVIIKDAGYKLKEKDELDTSKFQPGKNVKDNQISILRARKITIKDEDDKSEKIIAASTIEDALNKAKIDVSKEDKVTPSLKTRITKDTTIKIERAFTVQINADSKVKKVNFLNGTVADALKAAKITLGENDEVIPTLDQEIKPGDVVDVKRVSYETREQKETIKYKIVTNKTAKLYAGQRQTSQKGENGEKVVTYKDKVVDGEVVDSTALNTEVTKKATDCIRLVGTKVKVIARNRAISHFSLPSRYTLDNDGVPTGIKATITGLAKAYTCNGRAGRTATGVNVKPGYIAVNPRQIPYGTEMYIVSSDGRYVYGYCIAADTGGFVKRHTATCDLYMDTLGQCYQWGNKNVNIYILNWGNGRV